MKPKIYCTTERGKKKKETRSRKQIKLYSGISQRKHTTRNPFVKALCSEKKNRIKKCVWLGLYHEVVGAKYLYFSCHSIEVYSSSFFSFLCFLCYLRFYLKRPMFEQRRWLGRRFPAGRFHLSNEAQQRCAIRRRCAH